MRGKWLPLIVWVCLFIGKPASGEELFKSSRITPVGQFTSGIEGPAVDPMGALFAANFKQKGTIGRLAPGATKAKLYAELGPGRVGNGIRFSRDGLMFIADYKGHSILVSKPLAATFEIYFRSSDFHQPNDIAIAPNGSLYASDPDFSHNTGRIWKISKGANGKTEGSIMSCGRKMGETNGLDFSPDGSTLYVSESKTNEIWAYGVIDNSLTKPRLIKRFDSYELDGLRTDIDGTIYVARNGAGKIAAVKPDGTLLREVSLLGKNPTNLSFGGTDGKTVFVTQADGGYIESFRADNAGRETCSAGAFAVCP